MDGAQEEVLTCLGLFLWDRLQQLWQRMRSEEQTWQLLLHLSTLALRQNFELAAEQKQGGSATDDAVCLHAPPLPPPLPPPPSLLADQRP